MTTDNLTQKDFEEAGFTVHTDEESHNKLYTFLKEHYPSIIQDNEINLNELKAVLGLPIDTKVNGYGLSFIGRQVARAKYASSTDKAFKVNHKLSKNFETTENLVLKGDNLEVLKLLKSYYTGKIKCIYIDPPYNTNSENFVYPDRFDVEEREVLELANLTQEDIERMEFSFKSPKNHNGWLTFMYPRLWLAWELLTEDGVIFISIDDNEQANLKLLCDEIFGEENSDSMIWRKAGIGRYGKMKNTSTYRKDHEYILVCYKNIRQLNKSLEKPNWQNAYGNPDNDPRGNYKAGSISRTESASNKNSENYYTVVSPSGKKFARQFDFPKKMFDSLNVDNRIYWGKNGDAVPSQKVFVNEEREVNTSSIIFKDQLEFSSSLIEDNKYNTTSGSQEIDKLLKVKNLGDEIRPKPCGLIEKLIQIATHKESIVLDFFAGSGTTGQAVMNINKKYQQNRKFILCQIDEKVDNDKKNKNSYLFCKNNNLLPSIFSITIERLNRAGEKIKQELEAENQKLKKQGEKTKPLPDIGYKVFDTIEAPHLDIDETGQISFKHEESDALSRIYNMIFTVGIDEPSQMPECLQENVLYKIGNNYYITNATELEEDLLKEAIQKGKVYIDGWTASLNTTLQHYKEDVKIIF